MARTDSLSIGTFVLLCIYVTCAIRNLKEGPMIGPDSRQYKTAPLPRDNHKDVPTSKAAPVQVICTERSMIVIIRADLHSNGRRITDKELQLGRSTESCKASKYSDTEYVIQADLHQCGSELMIEGDHLVYLNHLIYTPKQNSYGIARTSDAAIPVECHYKRTHFVSSINVRPSEAPFTTKSAIELISFSFELMRDDWRSKRSNRVYHHGEIMNIQASFVMAEHAPFRLIMDSCVATPKPDSASVPSYAFVQNHGCLVGSKSPGSSARFMPRKQNDVLQMQMDAFRFNEDHRNSIYITCNLKIVDLKVNNLNKACTYSGNRWLSVDGKDEVCKCCETVCHEKQITKWSSGSRLPNRSVSGDSAKSKTMMLGPIKVLG
ncbi:zona pellucida sperm-binding protein 3-like [Triplophysa rosa]|uniref:Zona pellucida sperm-binding protein 3 n=1 Tax=Triplophysa rosa TaxID=992332 RepID=A0A9W7X2D8_TRIRA|nr:zona pellucida sperm-binding protein 3-like [Triplophysa rosa]KAI7812676.1 putative zona pellucida sperm-binding protein 3-like [Triplophysa rosa]